MAKQVFVLYLTDPDGAPEILGVYSDSAFARIQAQIHVNHVNDYADEHGTRTELPWVTAMLGDLYWEHAKSYELPGDHGSPCIVYYVVGTTLDEDVRL